jgi:protochlorophyllide reductase
MRVILLLALLDDGAAFKFLSNFKASSLIPRPSAMIKRRRAAKVFGDKKLAVITGASSGVGLATATELLRTGEYHVFGAARDLEKMRAVAKDLSFPDSDFTPLQVKLDSFESVREFCKDLEKAKLNKPIDRLICSAAAYQPGEIPAWTTDGHEQTMQVNFLSNFLMVSLLLPGMTKARDPRVILVGSARADDGVVVYPRADLGALDGLKKGGTNPISMLDGNDFCGAKAYKDSKLSLSMLSNMLHKRYHKQTGIAFSTIYPGQIKDSALFASKPPLETSASLPEFVKSLAELEVQTLKTLGLGSNLHADGLVVDNGKVSTSQASKRLFQVVHDGRCSKSGLFWSWKEGKAAAEAVEAAAADGVGANSAKAGWATIYECEPSDQVLDFELGQELWKHSCLATDALWPPAYQARSPCPTLVVVGAITKAMNRRRRRSAR